MTDTTNADKPNQVTLTWSSGDRFIVDASGSRTSVVDGDKQDGFSPMEALLASLGGCMAIDVRMILEKMRSGIAGLRVEVEGDRESEPPRYYHRIRLHFAIDGDVDRNQAERAVKLSIDKYCSVFHTLRQDIEVSTQIDIV